MPPHKGMARTHRRIAAPGSIQVPGLPAAGAMALPPLAGIASAGAA